MIVTETEVDGRIIAVNAAWSALCGFAPEDALGKTPRILQGEMTSKTKARHFAREVHTAGQSCIRAKLVNYTKSGRPFVHCLQTRRVMDDRSGREYFVTESHEETDPIISNAMLGIEASASVSRHVRDAGFATVATAIVIALLPASLQALRVLA